MCREYTGLNDPTFPLNSAYINTPRQTLSPFFSRSEDLIFGPPEIIYVSNGRNGNNEPFLIGNVEPRGPMMISP